MTNAFDAPIYQRRRRAHDDAGGASGDGVVDETHVRPRAATIAKNRFARGQRPRID
jgi:hypothetical protein